MISCRSDLLEKIKQKNLADAASIYLYDEIIDDDITNEESHIWLIVKDANKIEKLSNALNLQFSIDSTGRFGRNNIAMIWFGSPLDRDEVNVDEVIDAFVNGLGDFASIFEVVKVGESLDHEKVFAKILKRKD